MNSQLINAPALDRDRDSTLICAAPLRTGLADFPQSGGSAFVYILDDKNRKQLEEDVVKTFQNTVGIRKIVDSGEFHDYGLATAEEDPRFPDIYLLAEKDYAFNPRKGAHGDDASLPSSHGIFITWGKDIQLGVDLGTIPSTKVASTAAKSLRLTIPAPANAPLSELFSN